MNCYIAGMFGCAMIGASVATLGVSEEQRIKLQEVLTEDQRKAYDRIVTERRDQYMQGLFLGLVIAYFSKSAVAMSNEFHRVMFFIFVTLFVCVLYYYLMPKSDYMLSHMSTQQQVSAWLDVYKEMKYRYFLGFLIGIASSIPIGAALCNK